MTFLCLVTALCHSSDAGQKELQFAKKPIAYTDLPAELCGWLEKQGINNERFEAYIASVNRKTAERELQGEYDHLIHFFLQSESFTSHPKLEPALSAHEFFNNLNDSEKSKYLAHGSDYSPPKERMPNSARARMNDFIRAVRKESKDRRLAYFKAWLNKTTDPTAPLDQQLYAQYARAMKFLYRKEFASRTVAQKDSAAFIASLYQERGHSTDTQIEANFAVYIALASLKAQSPSTRIKKVLIVGPGLDFAPRTDLIDLFGPQSYQPFAVADALLKLELSDTASLRIHCVDINERVIDYLKNLSKDQSTSLSLISGIADSNAHPLTNEYKEYFLAFGSKIGKWSAMTVPPAFAGHLSKSVAVSSTIAGSISADKLNIITERYEPSPGYELVIVTNVFPYFNASELLFALTNISTMMAEGGYLIHNELQTVPSSFVTKLGLPLKQARTVLIAESENTPLFDGIAIHQKMK